MYPPKAWPVGALIRHRSTFRPGARHAYCYYVIVLVTEGYYLVREVRTHPSDFGYFHPSISNLWEGMVKYPESCEDVERIA